SININYDNGNTSNSSCSAPCPRSRCGASSSKLNIEQSSYTELWAPTHTSEPPLNTRSSSRREAL
ncbi:hypothetical protein OFB58_26500, partial [Escherichia coli]|nr:hypothetical protein [Escherichia coli]